MMPRFLLRAALTAAFAVLFVGQSPALAQDADAVFDRLQQKYASLDGLRAQFTQTMSSAYSEDVVSSSGMLVLQGDRYRVETDAQILVADGEATYVYLPSQKQLIINDLVEDETSFTPTEFLMNYDERFDVQSIETVQVNGQRHHKLDLTPKTSDSFFREATIWVRDRDMIITRLEVLDVNETRMQFTLDEVELNPVIDSATFRVTPASGDEVIDLRS